MSCPVQLDHVGVAIKDLEYGRKAYERLGFTLTPRSIHRGSPTPGAPVEPFGSGNHCAMFREGYLEVVGLTDPTIYSNIKALVARYEGAHIVAFGVGSADITYAELSGRGIPIQAPRQLERDAAYGPAATEFRRAAFRNMYFDQAAYPESRLLYIEHLTPDVLWQPHLLDHPNGVIALRDIFLCVPDARAAADKYSTLFGAAAQPVMEGEWRIALMHGYVWIVTPAAWAKRAPGAETPPLPSPAGIGFRVRSIAATRALLVRKGVETHDGPDGGIWVGPEHACGAAIYFFEPA
ncbi:MAG: VOC family protein [Burkholderiales bacterium]|nr:VOC family protein [Burkholderiales bacterium]